MADFLTFHSKYSPLFHPTLPKFCQNHTEIKIISPLLFWEWLWIFIPFLPLCYPYFINLLPLWYAPFTLNSPQIIKFMFKSYRNYFFTLTFLIFYPFFTSISPIWNYPHFTLILPFINSYFTLSVILPIFHHYLSYRKLYPNFTPHQGRVRIPTVKLKIPGKLFLKSEYRTSVAFKL